MYAIVRSGGKQYRVEEGRTLTVDRLRAEEGATVELADVLLIADDGEVTVGAPVIEGARVLAEVEAHGRHKKIIVFKYKAKVRTRKKTGHRQAFTRLAVREILRPGQEPKAVEKPKRRRRKAEEEGPAEAPAAEVEAPAAAEPVEAEAEAPAAAEPVEAEAPAPPKRRRRKAPEAEAEAEAPAAEAEAPAAEPPEVEEAKPKRRTRRKAPEAKAEEAAEAEAPAAGEAESKPKRRSRRKSSEETE